MPVDSEFLESLLVCPIGPDLDTSRFKCKEEIDWFLTNVARDHHERRITTVTCWLKDADLAGYITTSMTTLDLKESSGKAREELGLSGVVIRKGGESLKRFPALLIGMLGVDERYRGKGLASRMVTFAIGQARATSKDIGCRFVIVDSDSTPEATGLYQKAGFVRVERQKDRATVAMYFDLGARIA